MVGINQRSDGQGGYAGRGILPTHHGTRHPTRHIHHPYHPGYTRLPTTRSPLPGTVQRDAGAQQREERRPWAQE